MRPAAPPVLAPQWRSACWAGRGGVPTVAGSLGAGSVRSPRPAVSGRAGQLRFTAAPARSPGPGAQGPDPRLDATGRRRPASPRRRDVRLLPHGFAHLAWNPRQRCASSTPAAYSPGSGGRRRGARRTGLGRAGRAELRSWPGWGYLGDRPVVSRASLRLGGCSVLCLPTPASRLLPVPVFLPSTPLRRSLCLSGSLIHLYHSAAPRLLCYSLSLSISPSLSLSPCCNPLGSCPVPRSGSLGRAACVGGAS